jgi:outer membrane protein assembly factor BamE (lipoprotein component of BamABCDE complex)
MTESLEPQGLQTSKGLWPRKAARFGRRSARLAVLAAGLAALSACQAQVSVHGNMPTMEELAVITPGQDDRDTVLDRLGTPSTLGTFQDDKWYYIGSKIETEAFFLPEEVDRQIMIVTFDDFGVVEKTEFLGMADAIEVEPQSRITPTEGIEFTVWQQIFGNFGRLPGAVGGQQQR